MKILGHIQAAVAEHGGGRRLLELVHGANEARGEKQRYFEWLVTTAMFREAGGWAKPCDLAGRWTVMEEAHRLAESGAGRAVELLGHAWVYQWALAMTHGREEGEESVVRRLWEGAFEGQEDGPLHPLTRETLLESFVYDELRAIHAAFGVVMATEESQRGGMMEQVRRAVKWHVENTHPDNTTTEPWGLAAFAALDETGTFAEQQSHDATVQLSRGENGLILALLADAVLTLEWCDQR